MHSADLVLKYSNIRVLLVSNLYPSPVPLLTPRPTHLQDQQADILYATPRLKQLFMLASVQSQTRLNAGGAIS